MTKILDIFAEKEQFEPMGDTDENCTVQNSGIT